MGFEVKQKWIVTEAGASEEGWPWMNAGDVVEVLRNSSVEWEFVDSSGAVAILVNFSWDVENMGFLVPFIETN